MSLYAAVLKRSCDIVAALVLLVVLAPVLAVVAVAVWAVLGRPVLFADERAGRGGRPIRVFKFRSMTDARDGHGRPLPDETRLGAFGRFLRRTSLDELPQLLNVLRGDMSMVGPRPLPLRYVARYTPRQATRLDVRPGLTGWAQIHGRNSLGWPERLELDAEYVGLLRRPLGFLTDLWIVVATLFQMTIQALTGRGISAPGSATMPEFEP